jgi:hypothetical protein
MPSEMPKDIESPAIAARPTQASQHFTRRASIFFGFGADETCARKPCCLAWWLILFASRAWSGGGMAHRTIGQESLTPDGTSRSGGVL